VTPAGSSPCLVAFAFDYADSERWQDLPRLRDGLTRLVDAWTPHMRRYLAQLTGTTKPTDVMQALQELLWEELGPDDSVLIYIGGHGARLGDDHFIAAPDAAPDALTVRSGLSATDLAAVVSQARPRQITLLLDACHSGAGAARIAAAVDAVLSRERREGLALAVISSARPFDGALDGRFLEALHEVLSDSAPSLWSERDERIAPSQVARALRERCGEDVESREHGYVEAVIPNLMHRRSASADAEVKRQTIDHFVRAASSVESGVRGWFFTGRAAALAAIADWLDRTSAGILVVTGAPGSGKSAILGRVALLVDPDGRAEVASRRGDPDPLLADLPALGQVSVAVYAREKTLARVIGEIARGLGLPAADRDEMLALLSERAEPACVLVDALDEAIGADAVPIAAFLRDLADLPRVRVLVGTRPDRARAATPAGTPRHGPILRTLEPDEVHDLADDDRGSHADIAEYVARRLGHVGEGSPYRDCDAAVEAIAEEVADRVDGVFLYARLIVQVLLGSEAVSIEPGWQAKLPGAGRGNLLAAVVDDDLRRVPPDWRSRVRGMLMALAWAEGEGLPRYRIWPAVATAVTGQAHTDADATETLARATWYLAESAVDGQAVYRLHHEELARHFQEVTKGEH
jgi:hypothetical protein